MGTGAKWGRRGCAWEVGGVQTKSGDQDRRFIGFPSPRSRSAAAKGISYLQEGGSVLHLEFGIDRVVIGGG